MTGTDTVTQVRQRLVKLSADMYGQSKPYMEAMIEHTTATLPHERAVANAAEGLISGNVFAFTLAAVLRVAQESDHPAAPILAERMARMVAEAMNSGLDWLEDANDDLDGLPEPAPTEQIPGQLAIAAEPGR